MLHRAEMRTTSRRIRRNGSEIKEENCIVNFLAATEKGGALEAICEKLVKIESDTRRVIPMVEVKIQNSAMLEMMVPLLEAAATITADNTGSEEYQRLLQNVRQACATRVLCSQMNRMSAGTGSAASSYYFVMGLLRLRKIMRGLSNTFMKLCAVETLNLIYTSGHGVEQDFKKAFGLFERGAHNGDFEFLSEVGRYLKRGYGVREDKRKGLETLSCSASSGSIAAQY